MANESDRKTKGLAPIQWNEKLVIDVDAKPMPKTSMRGSVFVFGPTYTADRGILLEARTEPGGEPVEGVPVSISSLFPDTALTSGDLEMEVGVTKYTDANGIAEFPVRYRGDAPLHDQATFTISGGDTTRRHEILFRKVPSDPDEAAFMAAFYPGRPELGEAYAEAHLRIYAISGKYNHGSAGMPPQLDGVQADLFKSDGTRWGLARGNAALSESSDTITWRIDSKGGSDRDDDFVNVEIYGVGELEQTYQFGGYIHAKRDFPERFFQPYIPFLYAPVRTARIGESIYLQWPTYTNHQPGEHYTLNKSPGLDIEIFPFEFGDVALARLTCNRDFSPVIDLERVVDGKSTVIDRVLLNWLGG